MLGLDNLCFHPNKVIRSEGNLAIKRGELGDVLMGTLEGEDMCNTDCSSCYVSNTATSHALDDENADTAITDAAGDENADTATTNAAGNDNADTAITDAAGDENADTATTDADGDENADTATTNTAGNDNADTAITDAAGDDNADTATIDAACNDNVDTAITDAAGDENADTATTDAADDDNAGTGTTGCTLCRLIDKRTLSQRMEKIPLNLLMMIIQILLLLVVLMMIMQILLVQMLLLIIIQILLLLTQYKLGQVLETVTSADGVVHSVKVRYKNYQTGNQNRKGTMYSSGTDTVVTRSVQKLSLIVPVDKNGTHSNDY